ncbi:hypothetical protein HAX54_019302 [Datura stramonium]|uniref:Uncharacterized protein n=1 Tax=Datura stramonium TaxID=4076 RepID=A0ABS8UR89_DATST|nr:hypothetical protein [Datura stramonium]
MKHLTVALSVLSSVSPSPSHSQFSPLSRRCLNSVSPTYTYSLFSTLSPRLTVSLLVLSSGESPLLVFSSSTAPGSSLKSPLRLFLCRRLADYPTASSNPPSVLSPLKSPPDANLSPQMDDNSRISDVGSTDNSLDTQTGDTKKRNEMQPRYGVWDHFDKFLQLDRTTKGELQKELSPSISSQGETPSQSMSPMEVKSIQSIPDPSLIGSNPTYENSYMPSTSPINLSTAQGEPHSIANPISRDSLEYSWLSSNKGVNKETIVGGEDKHQNRG